MKTDFVPRIVQQSINQINSIQKIDISQKTEIINSDDKQQNVKKQES